MSRINGYPVRSANRTSTARVSSSRNKPTEIPTHNNLKYNSYNDDVYETKLMDPLRVPDVNGVTQYDRMSRLAEKQRTDSLVQQRQSLNDQYHNLYNEKQRREKINNEITEINNKIDIAKLEMGYNNPVLSNGQTVREMKNNEHLLNMQRLQDIYSMKKDELERELVGKQTELDLTSENLLYQRKINQEKAEIEDQIYRLKYETEFEKHRVADMKEMSKNRHEAEFLKAKLNTLQNYNLDAYLEAARQEGHNEGEKYNAHMMTEAQNKVHQTLYESTRDEEKLKTQLDHINGALDMRTRYYENNLQQKKDLATKDQIIKKRDAEINDLARDNFMVNLKNTDLQYENDIQTKAMEDLQRESKAHKFNISNSDALNIIPDEPPIDQISYTPIENDTATNYPVQPRSGTWSN